MNAWEEICRAGDSEEQVRAALLQEFDVRWLTIERDIRAQLLEQGCDLATALAAAEQCRHVFRADAGDQAPAIMDRMASTAAPRH
jgi:hypothetical protein